VTEKGKLNTVHSIHPSDQLSAVILITTSCTLCINLHCVQQIGRMAAFNINGVDVVFPATAAFTI